MLLVVQKYSGKSPGHQKSTIKWHTFWKLINGHLPNKGKECQSGL